MVFGVSVWGVHVWGGYFLEPKNGENWRGNFSS